MTLLTSLHLLKIPPTSTPLFGAKLPAHKLLRIVPYPNHNSRENTTAKPRLYMCHFTILYMNAYEGICLCAERCIRAEGGQEGFISLGTLNKLYTVHLGFDYDQLYESGMGIFHFWHHTDAQKYVILEYFQL